MNEDKISKIKVTKNGPYQVSGNIPLRKEYIKADPDSFPYKWEEGEKYPDEKSYVLCRCGHSNNKPFCTGMHAAIGFDGTETDSRENYIDQAEKIKGPDLGLTDVKKICSSASFCGRSLGTWELTRKSDNREYKEMAIEQACNCPSGRLVAWDKKTKNPIEPEFNPSISIIEDLPKNVSGPIWAKGNIEVESADGQKYETRNRITLCRCGQSKNKPFCDKSHVSVKFNDGDKMLKK
jgi:CDGSH-type Zn-finger protein